MRGEALGIISLCLLLMQSVMGQGEVAKPAKVLVLGNPPNIRIVSLWLEGDPMVDPRQVPARTHLTPLQDYEIQRLIRQYFPRTYERLLEFEYIMLVMIEVFQLTTHQQLMIYDAMYKGGCGGFQDRSVMSMAGWIAEPWAASILSDAFPNDADEVVGQKFTFSMLPLRYKINTNPNVPQILSPYRDFEGVETTIAPGTTNIAIPKEGAIVTSYIVGRFPFGYPGAYPHPDFRSPGWMPHTMYWEYGNGTTWTHHDMLGGDLYWDPAHNPYSIDMILAEFMFATGRDLPSDVVLLHHLRAEFSNFLSTRGFIYSVLDFVDKFGASGTSVIVRMDEVSDMADVGKGQYLAQEYEDSLETMNEAIGHMEALRAETMKLKDRALLWVYLVEWLAISGVSLLTGFLLWTLMIRRRLYKEVAVTRAPMGD